MSYTIPQLDDAAPLDGTEKVEIFQLMSPSKKVTTQEIANLGGGTVETIVPGTGISVDATDPANPIVYATGGGGGGVTSVTATDGSVVVDNTDPTAPTVGLPYKTFKGLLRQTEALTSGVIEVGKKYVIEDYVAGDDFINVGAASNATGVKFTATGTTPTVWSNSSELVPSPIVTVLQNTIGSFTERFTEYYLEFTVAVVFDPEKIFMPGCTTANFGNGHASIPIYNSGSLVGYVVAYYYEEDGSHTTFGMEFWDNALNRVSLNSLIQTEYISLPEIMIFP